MHAGFGKASNVTSSDNSNSNAKNNHLIKLIKTRRKENTIQRMTITMNDVSISPKVDMPVWLSDSEIDPSWIKEKMPSFQDVTKCEVKDISNDRRRGSKIKDGATLLLELTSSDDTKESKTLVAKQVSPSELQLSRTLGLAREAIFYEKLAPKIKIPSSKDRSDSSSEQTDPCIPKIYYSSGDMNDGSKIVVMEDLSDGFVDSGILFGPGNPNNWKRDLIKKIADAFPTSVLTSFEVANQTFLAIANVHAAFWRDTTLLGEDWLRGSSWIRGQDEDAWWASQGMIRTQWKNYVSNYNDEGIRWDPLVWEIVDKAVKGISWELYRKRLNENANFCLVHGDFWPGNIMISKESNGTQELRLLDWEMVGKFISSEQLWIFRIKIRLATSHTHLLIHTIFQFLNFQVWEAAHKTWGSIYFRI